MPGGSGALTPPRRTEADSCTASTIASGVDRGGLDTDCAIAAPVVPSASTASAEAIESRILMIVSIRFPTDPHGYNSFFPRAVHAAPVPSRDRRARSAAALGADPRVSRDRGAARERRPPEVLLPVDVPLPFGQASYGARAQLYHRRRDDPLSSDAGIQRSSADGLGRLRASRRKRRDGEPRAAGEVDLRQHRLHEEAAPVARIRDRLDARARDLLAPVLSLEPVAVPAHARKGSGLQEDRHGELGPGGPDGARERAGDRRPRLAHRGARREARNPDVLHEDHRLRRGVARFARRASGLARAREDDAGQLDRQEPRRQYRLSLRA